MKKFFYMAVAAIAALSSCSSDNDAIIGEGNKQNEGIATFNATIESNASTRTTLDINKKVLWSTGDVIKVNSVEYKATNGGSATTPFTAVTSGEAATADGGNYYAYYPSTIATSTNNKGQLPAEYAYKSDLSYLPMYAASTTTDLAFKNICGVLAITVSENKLVGSSVKSIVVKSDSGKRMNGEFTATEAGELTFSSAASVDADKKVTLTFATSESIGTGQSKTFYIPLPPSKSIITIEVTEANNEVHTKTTNSEVIVKRNMIYPVSL